MPGFKSGKTAGQIIKRIKEEAKPIVNTLV